MKHFMSEALALAISVILFSGHGGAAASPHRNLTQKCDIYHGLWVYDGNSPLYYQQSCPFLDQEFNCLKSGRRDKYYLHYVWKPDGCDSSRFYGNKFLIQWEGKKIMFVGDSLGLNQWQSLCCMIYGARPDLEYNMDRQGTLSTLTIPSYNITIQYFRSTYLVDIIHNVLRLDSILQGKAWEGMDLIIFDTYHWWNHAEGQLGFKSMRYGRRLYKNRLRAFNMALNTWARWVQKNINPTKTKVFFQGVSPPHYKCNGKKLPFRRVTSWKMIPAEAVVKRVLSRMKGLATLLEITPLSKLRIDAHPEVYGKKGRVDCSHWCLPGLPDTWNQLLFSYF